MPKTHLDKKSLQKLYGDFSKENELVGALMRKPEYVAVIRLSMGKSQTSFENFLGMSKNLYKYEAGKIKPSERTARMFLSKFKALAPWEVVLQNFERFSSESVGWFAANSGSQKAISARKKGAESLMRLRKPTDQESEVAAQLAARNLRFKKDFKIGGVFVDFYIPSQRLAVECKRLTTRNRREHMKKVKEAAFAGYKVRFHEQNVKLVVVFESPLKLSGTERQELCGPYSIICENVTRFGDIIKDQSA